MDTRNIQIFALTTCIHCAHCKDYLDKKGIAYKVIHIDQLEGDSRKEAMRLVRGYNPDCSFPTVVINDGEKVLIGFSKKRYDEEFCDAK